MFKNKIVPGLLIALPVLYAAYLNYDLQRSIKRSRARMQQPLPPLKQPKLSIPPMSDEYKKAFDDALEIGDLGTAARILLFNIPAPE